MDRSILKTTALNSCLLLASFCAADNLYAADACAKSSSRGGQTSLVGKGEVGWTDMLDPVGNAWRNAAENLQSTYGSNVAYDAPVVQITVTISILGRIPEVIAVPISYGGQSSIEKAILNHVNIDKEQADPSSCDPSKNATNGTSTTSGSGGGGSGYYDYFFRPGSGCYGNCSGTPGTVTAREG